MGEVDEVIYSEGAGPATWAVVLLSLIAAGIAGSAWIRFVTAPDSISTPSPSGAVAAAIAALVALTIGLAGIETLVRRKIVLTGASLQVGRASVPLIRLSQPVLAGDRVPESIRDGAFARDALPAGCRALGDVSRAIVGQGTVTVVSSDPSEILVVYAWRPQALAYFLSRALDTSSDDSDAVSDWL